jgi:alkylation response protein AidB-like acyl-CoA dehydrogenase
VDNFDAWLKTCESLAETFAARADQHDRDGSFVFENAADMRAAGLHKLNIPTEYGGYGGTLTQMTRTLQTISRGDASTALGLAMHLYVMGQLSEQRIWAEDKFARLCRESVADGTLVDNVFSEPDMGSPSRGGLPATTARRVEGGYRVNGRKSWVTFAPTLGYFIISAALDEPAARVGILCVHHTAQGIELLNNWGDGLSLRASGSCDVVFHDVFVPDFWLVETRDPAQANNRGSLPAVWSTCGFAAVYLGIGEAALRAMSRYAKQRVPTALGKPIAELSHIQRALGQMSLLLRSANALLYAATDKWETQPDQRATMAADLAALKFSCTNASVQATDIAVRAAGANGLERKLPLERLLRDARAGLMHPPQDEAALELLGRAALAEV